MMGNRLRPYISCEISSNESIDSNKISKLRDIKNTSGPKYFVFYDVEMLFSNKIIISDNDNVAT